MDIEALRKSLNKQQTQLRTMMMDSGQHEKAMALFMTQHAALHSAKVTSPETVSLEDVILDDITEGQMRHIPPGGEHSVAWAIWHIARIEDIAMNILVADGPQVFVEGDWPDQLNVSLRDSGNAMDAQAVAFLSDTIDLSVLRAYRVAVGRRTREIVSGLQPNDLKQKVQISCLERVREEGAVVEAASDIVDYWGKRTIAGLLLMPASRHNLVHLNEALKLKRRRR